MKKNRLIFFCVLVILFFACGKKQNNLSSIEVYYYNYSFESAVPVNCDSIKNEKRTQLLKDTISVEFSEMDQIFLINEGIILDTLITDFTVLREIEEELNNLSADQNISIPFNARISCYIKYKDGRKERLCIGGYLANHIMYNGRWQMPNKKLLYIIKKNIGYYQWMGEKELKGMNELFEVSIK